VRGQNVAEKLHEAVSHHVGFEEFVAGVNGVVEELVQNLIINVIIMLSKNDHRLL